MGRVSHGGAVRESYSWIPGLSMDLDLRLDTLSAIVALVVTAGGALVLTYCARYFHDGDEGLGRFAGVFVAFAAAMFGLVVADNVLVLYMMWELTTVFSYLLIGHKATEKPNRRAALQALIVTTAGGLAMLAGLIMLAERAGSYLITDIVAAPPTGVFAVVAFSLVLAGAVSKSAIFPFHFWLPAAMAAPTPVSAYLHAAAMVKAGVFAIALLAPAFVAGHSIRWVIVGLGLFTMILGAWRSLRQYDLKLLLAYGTVSQLGMLVAVFGMGGRNFALAGVALLVAHATFKASLFLVVGAIDHEAGTRDLRVLTDLGRAMPWAVAVSAVSVASMVGLPPTFGFVAKESMYAALAEDGQWAVLAVLAAGSTLTFAYGARFLWGAFAVKDGVTTDARYKTGLLTIVPGVLAVMGLAAGLFASPLDKTFESYVELFPAVAHPEHLALWHGFGVPLVVSMLTVTLGIALFLARDVVTRVQTVIAPPPWFNAHLAYVVTMRSLDKTARGITVLTQRGSLPYYLGTVFVVFTAGSLATLSIFRLWPQEWRGWDHPVQVAAAAIAIVAALIASRVTQRVAAVLLVGITGYASGVFFALQGAPDLALTQFLVETLTVVVFVLVLRKLPSGIVERHSRPYIGLRIVLALATGVVMASLSAIAISERSVESIATDFPQQAYEVGGGNNVVNVTLIDIRAWDTMGEVSVLLVAATGVASLVFLRKRSGRVDRPDEEIDEDYYTKESDWLRYARLLDPEKRSIVLEVVTRTMFHTVLVLSLYLLFAGHNAPGGGFAGGLVAGLALVVRYLAGGRYELGEAARIEPGMLLGVGMLLAGGVGVAALVSGGAVLESSIWHFDIPPFGDVKLVTSLFFDVGVYMIVIGLVLDILRSLGAELDRRDAEEAQ